MAYALTYLGSCSRARPRRVSNLGTAFSMATSSGDMSRAEMATAKAFARMWTHHIKLLSGRAWPGGGTWDMILHCGPHARTYTGSRINHCRRPSQSRSKPQEPAGLSSVDADELERELVAARQVLAWYADAKNYERPARVDNHGRPAPVMRDRGSLARKTLAHLPKGRHDEPNNPA